VSLWSGNQGEQSEDGAAAAAGVRIVRSHKLPRLLQMELALQNSVVKNTALTSH
jgi:hypothetical protein